MSKKNLLGVFSVFLLLTDASLASEHIPAWAHETLLAPWYAAFNARDAESLADLYTPDGQVGDAKGRSEIIALFESFWEDSDISCSGSYDGFEIVADTAVAWGIDTCTETPDSGGEGQTIRSRWLAFYEKQDDGSWLCTRDNAEDIED